MTYEVGVSLSEQWPESSQPLVDDQVPAPPPGSRMRQARRSEGERSPALLAGRDAVAAFGGGIAEQIAIVAGQIHERLAGADVESEPRPTVDLDSLPSSAARKERTYVVDSVEVQFGLSATAKSGVGIAILADVGGSSSIQVTLTIKRVGQDHHSTGHDG